MNIAMRFVEICLFKAGPEDVPSSHWLLKITLLIYFMVGVAISRIDAAWDISLFTSLTDMLVMIVVTGLLLQFRGFKSRFQQTITAMAGAGSCLGIVGIPVVLLFNQVSEQERLSSYAMLLMIALMFWSLMVTAHIFRRSLDIKPGIAAVLTIAYTILSLLAVGLVISGVA
jgi:hypothetical protein